MEANLARLKAELKATCPKETLLFLVDFTSEVPSLDCAGLFSVPLTSLFSFPFSYANVL